jgi:hypothetical protein
VATLWNLQPLRLVDQDLERPSREFLEKTLHPKVFQLLVGLWEEASLAFTETAEDPIQVQRDTRNVGGRFQPYRKASPER